MFVSAELQLEIKAVFVGNYKNVLRNILLIKGLALIRVLNEKERCQFAWHWQNEL